MTHRFVARIVAAGAIGFAGMTAACGQSPTAPTAKPAPAPAAPAPQPAGLTLRAVTPSAGPMAGGDVVRVMGAGFHGDAIVTVDDVRVPVTRRTDTYIEVRTLAHAEGPVDVVVTNPDGESETVSGGYTFAVFSIDAGPGVVGPGGALTVSWHAPAGRGCTGGGDWIAIYSVGDPDETGAANGHSDLWYDHVCGAASGSWTVKAPEEPGSYEFRYMVGAASVARSGAVSVK